MSHHIKELYKVKSIHEAFYTGGNVEVLDDGSRILCQCNTSIQIIDYDSGRVCDYIGNPPQSSSDDDDNNLDDIFTFTLSKDNRFVVTSHKSNLIKLWNIEDGNSCLAKHWKGIHKGPIVQLELSSDNKILATGGTDSSVRLWNLQHNSCFMNFTQCLGVISVLKFQERDSELYLYGAGDDSVIRCWDCSSGELVLSLSGHYSKVTSIDFHPQFKYVVSCSRDKVLILWDAASGKQMKVVPLYESAESLVVLPEKIRIPGKDIKLEGGFYVAVGGDKGVVRIWDVESAKELYVQDNSLVTASSEEQSLAITHLRYCKAISAIIVTSAEHNIIVHDVDTFVCKKQLVGFSDEILSIALVGADESHMAIATNSNDIKLYNLSTMSCQILKGHTGFVLTLATSPSQPNVFASASKDHSIRFWMVEDDSAVCIMIGIRHTDSVSSLALPMACFKFAASVSQDTTLKLWTLPKKISKKLAVEPENLTAKHTVIAHDKDINDVSISPNDKLIATASFDKTAKLWKSDDLTALGTLRGHKRGVWSCRFSPVDQVLLTTSADATLKLWSISDLSCLKTLEGHDSSVLQGSFLTRGTQIITSGGDGLIKLWSIKTSECVASFDNHNGKIWSLVVSKDENTVYSGGSDSRFVMWQDWSEQSREERIKAQHDKALSDQRLANLIQSKDMLNAIKYALSLNRPATVLKIIKDLVNEGEVGLEDTISQLDEPDKQLLLNYATHWNTNSKHCYIAQLIISMMLVEITHGSLKPPQSVLEAIIPYTDRHFKRLTQLLQDLHFLRYTKQQINPLSS